MSEVPRPRENRTEKSTEDTQPNVNADIPADPRGAGSSAEHLGTVVSFGFQAERPKPSIPLIFASTERIDADGTAVVRRTSAMVDDSTRDVSKKVPIEPAGANSSRECGRSRGSRLWQSLFQKR